jgi:hypothetical protein
MGESFIGNRICPKRGELILMWGWLTLASVTIGVRRGVNIARD